MTTLQARARARDWHAPALLLLWQTAPVQVGLDEVGKFRVALGWSAGKYEDQQFNCAGDVTSRAPVRWRSAGATGTVWPERQLRVSGTLGFMDASSDSAWAHLHEGWYGGILLAREGEKFGIGGGLFTIPRRNDEAAPVDVALYLRFGRQDGVHFRMEGPEMSRPGGPPGGRLGIGYGYGLSQRPRLFVGLGLRPMPDNWNDPPGLLIELGIPMGNFRPMIAASLRANEGQTDWEVGMGVEVRLGGRRTGDRGPPARQGLGALAP
jgi:hypothetical protein